MNVRGNLNNIEISNNVIKINNECHLDTRYAISQLASLDPSTLTSYISYKLQPIGGAWLSERLRRYSNKPDVVGSIPVTTEFF